MSLRPSEKHTPAKIAKEPAFLSIAPKKIKKIKSRIAASFACYANDKNYDLLKARITFLTSNYKVGSFKKKTLNAGVYFNYPLLDRSTPEAREKGQLDSIDELDAFLRNALFVSKFRVAAKARTALSLPQKRALASLSFSHGFENRLICKFTRKKMEEISRAWIYEKN